MLFTKNQLWTIGLALCLTMFNSSRSIADPTSSTVLPTGLRELVLNDVADGELDSFDLFTAALILGGETDRQQLDSHRNRLNLINDQVANRISHGSTGSAGSAQSAAQSILRYLHNEVFRGPYEPGCSSLSKTMTNGTYNCVMGTLLFQVLAENAGLATEPMGFPDHVRCEVRLDSENSGERLTIETTAANGVSDFDNEVNSIEKPRATGRRLTKPELLAKVLYNRGLEQLAAGDFAGSLESTELSRQLDPAHQAAEENVGSVINNWALHLCGLGEFEQAIKLLKRGEQATSNNQLLRWNQSHIYARWLHFAEQEGDLATVSRVRSAAKNLRPGH